MFVVICSSSNGLPIQTIVAPELLWGQMSVLWGLCHTQLLPLSTPASFSSLLPMLGLKGTFLENVNLSWSLLPRKRKLGWIEKFMMTSYDYKYISNTYTNVRFIIVTPFQCFSKSIMPNMNSTGPNIKTIWNTYEEHGPDRSTRVSFQLYTWVRYSKLFGFNSPYSPLSHPTNRYDKYLSPLDSVK